MLQGPSTNFVNSVWKLQENFYTEVPHCFKQSVFLECNGSYKQMSLCSRVEHIFLHFYWRIYSTEDSWMIRDVRYLWIHQASWWASYRYVPSKEESWKEFHFKVSLVISSPVVVYIQCACSFCCTHPSRFVYFQWVPTMLSPALR